MKQSTKAALWAGLIFPGAGHFFLKCYLRGTILFVLTLLGMLLMVRDLFARGLLERIDFLTDQALNGTIPSDLPSVAHLLDLGPDTLMSTFATWLMVICWVVGIIDAYRIGRMQDQAKNVND